MSTNHVDTSERLNDIAVIGMAGRFPGARNLKQFWQNLCDGVESITFFSDEELLAAGVDPEMLAHPHYVKANAMLEGIEDLDAAFFGLSPREAEIMDPQQRLFLECSWEALEHAGYNPEAYPGAIGVFGGSGLNRYVLFNVMTNKELVESLGEYPFVLGNDKDFMTLRVSYKLNLKGPSMTVQSACSTALVSIHTACQSLLNGESDMALAGGVTIAVPQKTGYVSQQGLTSADGHCRAFDADASGTIFGSGVGVVLLKRLGDALADGDTIYSVIKGSAINNDGSTKVSFTAPSVEGQVGAISEALAISGVEADTISYVETHGTATAMGDLIEITALTEAFRSGTDRTGFCAIGSAKTNIGHLDTAAGVTALIKASLALKHKTLPANLHFNNPNPKIDFPSTPFYVNNKLTEWKTDGTPRRAGVSSFGFGGTNAYAVLEEPPNCEGSGMSREWQVLPLSARTDTALEQATDNLREHFQENPAEHLADAAYTLQVGRKAFNHRRIAICQNVEGAVQVLDSRDPSRVFTGFHDTSGGERPVVFMFPGTGSQYQNMALDLYETEPTFQDAVDQCCEILQPHLGVDLRDVMYPVDTDGQRDPQYDLNQTALLQPALFVIEYALTQLLKEWGVQPQAMIGHSLGEYVAACLAGVFTLEDALALVAKRARMVESLPTGAMLAVYLPEGDVLPRLAGSQLSIATVNGPAQCVVSGTPQEIEQLEQQLAPEGVTCIRVKTSSAFHSQMVEPILDEFAALVRSLKPQPPSVPFISNVTGTWITTQQATDPQYWASHLRQPVRFADGIRELCQDPSRIFLEVGPGKTLSSFVQLSKPTELTDLAVLKTVRSVKDPQSDVAFLLTALGRLWLSGVNVDWEAFSQDEVRHRIPLPTYPFERQRYWIDVAQTEPAATRSHVAAQQITAPRLTGMAELPQLSPEMESWLYELEWKRQDVSASSAAPGNRTGKWLIFADQGEVASELAARLQAHGQPAVLVFPGLAYKRLTDSVYHIPPAEPEPLRRLLHDAFGSDLTACRGIVHLWSVDTQMGNSDDELDALERAQRLGAGHVLLLAQQLVTMAGSEHASLWLATRGAQALADDAVSASVEQAALWGLGQTISIEHSHLWGGLIDLDPNDTDAGSSEALVRALLAPDGEERLLYRAGQRYVARMVRKRLAKQAPLTFRPDGSYLITGGLGSLGLVIARWMVERGATRLILMGRSKLPPRREWEQVDPADRMARLIASIRDLEARGATVHLASVDVTQEAPLAAYLDSFQAEWPPIRGVIHAAGVLSEDTVIETELDSLYEVMRPKVRGGWLLHRLLQDEPLDFFLMFSSVSSVLNLMRLASYSSANAFLDGLARLRRQQGLPALTINWGPWAEVGMAATDVFAQVSSAAGMGSLPPSSALTVLGHLLAERGNITVTNTEWRRFYGTFPTEGNAHLLARLLQEDASGAKQAASAKKAGRKSEEFSLVRLDEQEAFLMTYLRGQIGNMLSIAENKLDAGQSLDELGLDSLMAISLKNRMEADLGVIVPIRSFLQGAGIEELSKQVLELLRTQEVAPLVAEVAEEQRIRRRTAAGLAPLSFAQYRMWFSDQLVPNSTAYNLPIALRMSGELNVPALEQSFSEIVRRHEALRTTFALVDGEPVQVIEPFAPIAIDVQDLTQLPTESRDAEVEAVIRAEARTPFDLKTGPLFRFHLLCTGEQEHVLILNMHHIVFDHWSTVVFTQELAMLYEAYVNGKPSALDELPIQYSDYASWQRDTLQGDALQGQLDYWKHKLDGELSVLQLPIDRPRPPVQTYNGATQRFVLSRSLTAELKQLSQREGVTLFMTLLTAFKTLLYRLSGQEDILVGTSVAGRNTREVESLIGMFVNMLVLRTDLSGDPTFRELMHRVEDTSLEAFANQDVPFEKLVEELQPKRDTSRSPLFQVMFTLLNVSLSELESSGLKLSQLEADAGASKFDMTLIMTEKDGELEASLEYNTDLFDASTIVHLMGQWQTLLAGVVHEPDQRMSDLRVLIAGEQTDSSDPLVLQEMNDTVVDYDLDQLLLDAFVEQAERHPDRIALSYQGQTMTYGELHARSNQVAHFLRAQGVSRNQLVGILMERGLEMMVGLYGIVKSGAAYVPIDPDYPAERIRYMLTDSGASVLLTKERYLPHVQAIADEVEQLNTLLLLDPSEEMAKDGLSLNGLTGYGAPDLNEQPTTLPEIVNAPNDIAYMIYTSGSTGNPKGAKISHRAIINRLLWHQDTFQATPSDVVAQRTSVCFDVSVWELFWPLRHGAKLSILPLDVVKDPYRMQEHLVRENVTVMHFVPSLFSLFVYSLQNLDVAKRAIPSLRWVITSGEALPDKPVQLWFDMFPSGAKIANLYGPTEAAVDVTCYILDRQPDRHILIGKPIANTQIYILDEQGRPCPVLVKGELHIGGVQLAEGYHNKPEKTAEAFIPNHLPGTPCERLYKTGDLARILPDGNIEYLGRKDSQVKVRGYRIELGEVENMLIQHPNVENAAVLASKGADGNNTLTAYFSGDRPHLDVSELKSFLAKKMPEFMVPAFFCQLDAMPLTPNGKVDRQSLALVKVETRQEKAQQHVPPANELQAKITAIWSELLRRDAIGIHDNFFDLGGHSLLVVRVRDALQQELGVEIPMTDLFQYTTVKALADAISKHYHPDRAASGSLRDRSEPRTKTEETDIAIIGIGLRFPQARTADEFWANLRAGREGIIRFSEEEIEPFAYNQSPENSSKLVRAGAFVDDIDQFDAEFFQMSEREAALLDPQQRLFLQCTWEAIEDAGYDIASLEGPVALYAGAATNQYLPVHAYGKNATDQYQSFLASQPSFMATRVSYKLNLTGESMMINTACSTSLVAVHMACQSLLSGKSDYALAGGVSIQVPQKTGYLYEPNFILSPDGYCRTFDKDASGTVVGNGVGVVLLKRLSDAVREGDPIYAVIKGTAVNNDGSVKIGYTAPSIQGQSQVIAEAQAVAGVEPETITYMEAHGTGTKLGDPIEVAALTQVFRERTDRTQFCAIGSVKTNIGHLDTAAGIAGLIKTALALKHGAIPPTLHFKESNPEIDFAKSPFYVNTELRSWTTEGMPRRAGVSSFGIGGTNAHAILEEPPTDI